MSEFTHHEPKPGILALAGELTTTFATEVKEVLFRALDAHPKLEMDLLNVTRIDTAGVQLLILLHREAGKRGKPLQWLGYSLAVEDVLELLDLSHLIGRPSAVVWG